MENNYYLIDIQKLKKSKDAGGKNAYRKKRKEKKSKGLFYLIFTLTIIAALTISCKNKPTGTSDFSGWQYLDLDTGKDFTQFANKTIRSKSGITTDGSTGYLWATFDNAGIKFGQGKETSKPSGGSYDGYHYYGKLTKSLLDNATVTFEDANVEGNITFEAKPGEKISSIKVKITKGASQDIINLGEIDCQFVNE